MGITSREEEHSKEATKSFIQVSSSGVCIPGSKLVKEYVKAVYCHLTYLASMQSISCEILGWMKNRLESRFLGEISVTSDVQMTPPIWHKVKRN